MTCPIKHQNIYNIDHTNRPLGMIDPLQKNHPSGGDRFKFGGGLHGIIVPIATGKPKQKCMCGAVSFQIFFKHFRLPDVLLLFHASSAVMMVVTRETSVKKVLRVAHLQRLLLSLVVSSLLSSIFLSMSLVICLWKQSIN